MSLKLYRLRNAAGKQVNSKNEISPLPRSLSSDYRVVIIQQVDYNGEDLKYSFAKRSA